LLLADEQSVDDWLTAAGYTPASVHDRQLTTAVSEAIAAGRVPQERLPGLLAGQSQLQLLLAQEQLLGVAIERLKLSAVNVSQTLLQVQQRQDVPPGIGASAAAGQQQEQQLQEQLPHTRQLQLLQQMLGRQLGDARVVFAIHNYGYQGIFKGRHNFDRLGLPGRMLSAFVSPLARAAARAAAAAGAVTGAAVSAVNSQLAALAGVLQQLSPEHAADRNDSSSSSGGGSGGVLALSSDSTAGNPGLGLFSSLQAMLTKDSLAATAAALVQAETAQKLQQPQGPDQQGRQSPLEQQQGSGGWPSLDADEGSFEDPELLEGLHDVLAAAAANTGWEPPQENRHPQDQQPQLGSMDESSSSFDDDIDAAVDVNWLRAGLVASDVLVTVSEGYADELLQGMDPSGPANPELQALLASKGLKAVLNGLDTSFWDPSKDPLLPSLVRFDPETAGSGKAAAKRLLQQRLGLAVDPAAPLFVFVGRLTQQKGVDVILAALPQLMRQPAAVGRPPSPGRSQWAQRLQQAALGRPPSPKAAAAASAASAAADAVRASSSSSGDSPSVADGAAASAGELQVALLGNGERWMEDVLGQLDGRYPGRAVGVPAFNEPLAHLMMAGADFLLVPSRFEPCGLVALAGLRYGAVPLGTATGGLGDVVTPAVGYRLLNPGPEGDTGSFRKALRSLVNTVQDAAAEYGSPAHEARRAAAMAVDVSWQQPCAAWEQLLLQLCQGTDSTPSRSSSSRSGTAVAAERPVLPVQPLQLEPGEDAELSGAVAEQKQSPATAKPAVTLPARRRR
jgi:glycogen synthase